MPKKFRFNETNQDICVSEQNNFKIEISDKMASES